jgi:hypothetical protein
MHSHSVGESSSRPMREEIVEIRSVGDAAGEHERVH